MAIIASKFKSSDQVKFNFCKNTIALSDQSSFHLFNFFLKKISLFLKKMSPCSEDAHCTKPLSKLEIPKSFLTFIQKSLNFKMQMFCLTSFGYSSRNNICQMVRKK